MTLIIDSGFNYDTDASAYIDAVEAADGQALETATRYAINDFVIGCKQDNIWSAIKASCILAGARTKEGAIVPLVNASGTAPTLNGTAGGWSYNRKTGLNGNGTNNYINSNRAANADPQNNMHFAVVSSSSYTESQARPIGAYGGFGTADDFLGRDGGLNFLRCRSAQPAVAMAVGVGFYGVARTTATSFSIRSVSTNYAGASTSSVAPGSRNYFVFCSNEGAPFGLTAAKLAFYSIGESLDLALLDARVTALITAIGAAIP